MASPNFVPSLSFEHTSPWAFIYEVIGKSELSTICTPTATTPCAGANQRLRLLTRLKWILQALLRDSPVQERADRTNYLGGDDRNVLLRVLAYVCDISGSTVPDREWSTEYATLRRVTLEFLTNAASLLARLRPRVSGEEADWVRNLVDEMVQAWSRNVQLSYGEASIIREISAFITSSSSSTNRHQYHPTTDSNGSQVINTAFDDLLAASPIPSANQPSSFWVIHDWLMTQNHPNLPDDKAPEVVVLYLEATKKLRARPGYQYSFPLATYVFEEISLHVHSAYQLPPHGEIVTENQLFGSTLRTLSIEATAFSDCFPKHVYVARTRPLEIRIDRRGSLMNAQATPSPRGLSQSVNPSPVVPVPVIVNHRTPNMSAQPSPSLRSPTRSINHSPVALAAPTATPPMRDFMVPGTFAPWAPTSTYSPSHDRGVTTSTTVDDVRAYQLPDPVELPTRKQTRKEVSQQNPYQSPQARHPHIPQANYSRMPEPINPQLQEPVYSQMPQSIHSGMPQSIHPRVPPPPDPSYPPQLHYSQSIQTMYSPTAPMEFYGGLEVAEESQLSRPRDLPPPGQRPQLQPQVQPQLQPPLHPQLYSQRQPQLHSQLQPQLDMRALSTVLDEDSESISNLSAVGTATSRGKRGLFGMFSGTKRVVLSPLPASLEFCFSSCAKQIFFWCKKNPTSIIRLQYPNKEPDRFEMIVPHVPSSTQTKTQTRSIRLVAAIYDVAVALVHVDDDRWLYLLRDGTFQPLITIPNSTPAILHLALSNDGQTIAIGCGQYILCYQLNRHEVIGPWRLDPNVDFGTRIVRLQKMSFSPDSRRLISAIQIEHSTQRHAVFVCVWSCSDQVFRLEAQLDPVHMTVGYSDDTGISAIFLTGPSDALAVEQAFLTAALSKSYPSLLPITPGMRNQHLDMADKRIDSASQCPLLAYPHLCTVRSGRNKISLVDSRTGTIEKVADFTAERKGLHLRHENVTLAMQKHDTVCALWRTADENLVLKTMVREAEGRWAVSTMELGMVYRQAAGLA